MYAHGIVSCVFSPSPATLPMSAYKAQFAFNFGASALTVSACIDALIEAQGSIVLTSSVNGILGIGEAGEATGANANTFLPLFHLPCQCFHVRLEINGFRCKAGSKYSVHA